MNLLKFTPTLFRKKTPLALVSHRLLFGKPARTNFIGKNIYVFSDKKPESGLEGQDREIGGREGAFKKKTE